MVRKLNLQPSLPGVLAGLQRQAGQGIARASSSLTVQTGEAAPAGESIIPVRDVLTELTGVSTAVAAAEQELADAGARLTTVQALAQEAFDVADDALGAIGAKAQVLYGTGMPPSTTVGEATYYRLNAEGAVIAAYRLTSPWQGAEYPAEWAEVDFHESMMVGKIVTSRLAASEVAAAVGVFIDAMMQHLTVTGIANINALVADELFAKLAVVDKLQALTSIITEDMIATGAIKAHHVGANEISAAMLDVGENARWDSNGLVFYAPPQPGQAYDDWENRTPLIQIRPDGSSSVQVGDSAGLHGGITPSGLVYGTAGDFETIAVGGQDFATAISEGPRGVLSAVVPSNGINATTANGPYLSTKFTPEPGRMYRITFGFRGGAASAENLLVADFRQARLGASGAGSASRRLAELVMLAAQGVSGDASGVTHIDVSGDYLLANSTYLSNGETVIWIYIRTNAGTFYLNGAVGGQITTLPVLKIEDIGAAYVVETQTVSGTTPQPPSKVTKTDYIWSGDAVGIRPDGSNAVDSRLTLGAYNTFGSDMAEFIWYPFDLSRLNGATVNEALVQLTITQTYSGGQIAYYMDASTNRLSGRANLSQGWGGPGGSHNRTVPSGNLSRLIGKGGILIAPFNVGQLSSYGYFASRALLRVTYTK
ncbi:hypothetical protein EG850_10930 [Gulosibacter macacae]|uniref:Uncharacterized protein n=1 Tax=Gulosibacter macacae TaxID=2488791 RepID=A0A3P3VT14_9MICO|nr:hypothetical protein [Gulosibacter macacae]RRJ85895.1 hypothetical protein EG850_10930 [Gulosibacter macacae]